MVLVREALSPRTNAHALHGFCPALACPSCPFAQKTRVKKFGRITPDALIKARKASEAGLLHLQK